MTPSDPRPVVAVTRDERSDDRFSRALEAAGAHALPLPTVRIAPPEDGQALAAALSELPRMDWVVFTSANAVEATCGRPEWLHAVRAGTLRARIASVGAATAERLRQRGIRVDVTPSAGGGARDLLHALTAKGSLAGTRMLWPRSHLARRDLPDELARLGAAVLDPIAYRTLLVSPPALPEFLDGLAAGRIGAVAFLSPSSARGLASALPSGTLAPLAGHTLIASIGPTTGEAIAALGARVDIEVEGSERHAGSLAAAVMKRLSGRQGDAA